MFPQLPETCRRQQIIATHALLSECQYWQKWGFIRWWTNNPRSMSSQIDILMDKYVVVRDGYAADGEMADFINSHRELMDRAWAEYDSFDN